MDPPTARKRSLPPPNAVEGAGEAGLPHEPPPRGRDGNAVELSPAEREAEPLEAVIGMRLSPAKSGEYPAVPGRGSSEGCNWP